MELRLTGAACVFEGTLPAGAAFALCDDPDRVLFVEVDGSLRWLDLRAGETWPFATAWRAATRGPRPRSLRTTSDGMIAALARGSDVELVRPDSDAVVTLASLAENVSVVALLDGGARVVTASRAAARVWEHDAATGDLLRALEGAPGAASPCGRYLAAVTRSEEEHFAEVWRAGELVMRAPVPDGTVALSFSGDGRWLWGMSDLWYLGATVWRREVSTGLGFDARCGGDPRLLSPLPGTPGVALVDTVGNVSVLLGDVLDDEYAVETERAGSSSLDHLPHHAAASPDGRAVIVATEERAWRVLVASGDVLSTAPAPDLASVATSHDGRAVAVAREREIAVLDAETLSVRWRLEGHERPVRALAFAPGGALLSLDAGGSLRAWDLSSGAETWALALPLPASDWRARLATSACGSWAAVTTEGIGLQSTRFVHLDGPSVRESFPGAASFLPMAPAPTAVVFEAREAAPHLVVRVVDVVGGRVLRELPHVECDLERVDERFVARSVQASRDGRCAVVVRAANHGVRLPFGDYCFHWQAAVQTPAGSSIGGAYADYAGRGAVAYAHHRAEGERVALLDPASGEELASAEPFPACEVSLTLSADERAVFVADRCGRLFRFELA